MGFKVVIACFLPLNIFYVASIFENREKIAVLQEQFTENVRDAGVTEGRMVKSLEAHSNTAGHSDGELDRRITRLEEQVRLLH